MRYLALIFVSSWLFLSNAQATENSAPANPYHMLEQVGQTLFTELAVLNKQPAVSQEQWHQLVDKQLMPYIDVRFASLKMLGKHLRRLEKPQIKQFTEAMHDYLQTTYVNALKQYTDQKIVFSPAQTVPDNKKIIKVKARLVSPGKPDIDLIFQMRKNKRTQEWKVFDLVAENISLLNSKRSEIQSRIAKVGIDTVIAELKAQSQY